MDKNWNDADAVEPDDGARPNHQTAAEASDDDEAAFWIAQFAKSGPPVDPDRVWLQIAAQLEEAEPPRSALIARAFRGAAQGFQRVARFATITGGGWGGPLVVGLFAVLIIAALIAARTSQGHGLS